MRAVTVVMSMSVLWACGDEIGDACFSNGDCSPTGERLCDTSSEDGYCTIRGCDFNTCPEEAVCVRFFANSFTNRPCDPATENSSTDACNLDELCSLVGQCVPRSSELRFCMRTCEGADDCREGYECRDLDLMIEHGGEPVLGPGVVINSSNATRFCAPSL